MTASKPTDRPETQILPILFLLLAAFGIQAPDAAAQTIDICGCGDHLAKENSAC